MKSEPERLNAPILATWREHLHASSGELLHDSTCGVSKVRIDRVLTRSCIAPRITGTALVAGCGAYVSRDKNIVADVLWHWSFPCSCGRLDSPANHVTMSLSMFLFLMASSIHNVPAVRSQDHGTLASYQSRGCISPTWSRYRRRTADQIFVRSVIWFQSRALL